VIGLDTNVLVRYIMQDDPVQSAQATKLVDSLNAATPGFVSLVSVIELVWVLSTCFELRREQIMQALEALVRAKQLVVDRTDQVVQAMRTFKSGSADFADCLISSAASSAGCPQTMTFDVVAAKTAGMELIT
jgi:predicted nucleic-acid-binding protein